MAHFFPVSPLFWDDERVSTWNDAQQKLALYLLTCKHRNLEGLYVLKVEYAAADLRWNSAKVRKYLAALELEGFCEYDEAARVVLLPKALDYYQPKSRPQLKGALADMAKVPATPLKERFMVEAESRAPELFNALANGISVNGDGPS